MTVFDAKAFLKTAPNLPGVYRMYDADEKLLYVGKAKNLKKRLSSYFRRQTGSLKTDALVAKIDHIELAVTQSEIEALLLEQDLIKAHKPPFNILLRDDKSYPYIVLDQSIAEAPRFKFFRGRRRPKQSFGPFPNSYAVRDTLNLLYKIFRVRQCQDSMFRHRSRPCLQHQIGRCSAPCVNLISAQDYQRDVHFAQLFLQGKNEQVTAEIQADMLAASEALDFEAAARYRDQIQAIRLVQAEQAVTKSSGHADVFAVAQQSGSVCVFVMFVRNGSILGSKGYFPDTVHHAPEDILEEFVSQFYLGSADRDLPEDIITPTTLSTTKLLAEAIESRYERKVSFSRATRTDKLGWMKMAETNAQNQLVSHLNHKKTLFERFMAVQEALSLKALPKSMECFDISHTQGNSTVASCVHFDAQGPNKRLYRRYDIQNIKGGDDYAAMRQVLERRYAKLKSQPELLPDIVLIDGGKGQLSSAMAVFERFDLPQQALWSIAKGEGRKAGLEILHHGLTGQVIDLPADSVALHLLQHIRDEAHRFAITGHRAKRAKASKESILEHIQGVGSKRRQALLKHFGGWQALSTASAQDIAKVPGISQKLAETIYFAVHSD
ncbi:MAG: excinuclease ABC subunit UvrC [Pseudomonadota bacterium]|nr:excinuclease ABC subunit UvrC [Pseudomonadota bacterium]